MRQKEAYERLTSHGVKPSVQRLAIMDYLLTHLTHPTVEDVYQGLCKKIPTLSRTTVYNTLRLLSESHAAQMITIDDHHVCYDGIAEPHVHFLCKRCGYVCDLQDEQTPHLEKPRNVNGHILSEVQLYYKGICARCNEEVQEQKTIIQ